MKDPWKTRMILPEHGARLRQSEWDARNPRREKPVLDQQEWELISEALNRSRRECEPVKLRLYDPYEDKFAEGLVDRVDLVLKQIRIGGEWVKLDSVIGVG